MSETPVIKICHLTTDSEIGGTEKCIAMLLEGLSSSGFRQSLIVLLKRGPLNDYCDTLSISNYALNLNSIFKAFRIFSLILYLKRERPDILISYLFHSNIIARIVGRLLGIKVIICGQRNIDLWRNIFHVWSDRYTSPLCDKIISNTQAGKKRLVEIERIPPDKIVVIPNGVKIPVTPSQEEQDNLRKKLGFGRDFKFILCPASFQKKKGHEYLIKAFKKISEIHTDIHLVLAGQGKEKKNIEALILENSLENNIFLTGVVQPIYPLIVMSECVVLPSIWEGMPNIILEAMAMKKPVVATCVGGVSELITHEYDGILVDAHNEKMLEHALSRIIQDDDLKSRLVINAFNTINQKFTESKTVGMFANILMHEYEKKNHITNH